MGLGDIVMPGILVVAAYHNISNGLPVALSVLAGTLIGFLVLMTFVIKGKPQAGLPLLCSGAILGYLHLQLYVFFGVRFVGAWFLVIGLEMILLAPDFPIQMVQRFVAHRAGDLLKEMLKPHVSHLQDVFLFDTLQYFLFLRGLYQFCQMRKINRVIFFDLHVIHWSNAGCLCLFLCSIPQAVLLQGSHRLLILQGVRNERCCPATENITTTVSKTAKRMVA